jgi:hypothetical protein
VRRFTYTAKLPSCNKVINIKELLYFDYKQLVKTLTNDNNHVTIDFFEDLIKNSCEGDTSLFTFIDKIIVLLTIRAVCISPDLELTVTCPATDKTFNTNIQIFDIINNLSTLNLSPDIYSTKKTYNDNKLIIELGMPGKITLDQEDFNLISAVIKKLTINGNDVTVDKHTLIEHLPMSVLKDISDYVLYLSNTIRDIKLLDILSPYTNENNNIQVPLNLFANSILDFLKMCFKRGLISLYELEYFLISKLHIDFDLIKNSTLAELNIYINLFKDEKRDEESRNKANKGLNLHAP